MERLHTENVQDPAVRIPNSMQNVHKYPLSVFHEGTTIVVTTIIFYDSHTFIYLPNVPKSKKDKYTVSEWKYMFM